MNHPCVRLSVASTSGARTYVCRVCIVNGPQALRAERERLEKERDKKIDAAIRRIQRERLEFEETSKAEAEEEARRLDEVRACVVRSHADVYMEC